MQSLRLPVVAAPMLIVSGPELVIAACRAGVLGAFPLGNPRGEGELDAWLERIERELAEAADAGESVAPYVPNLVVHPSNTQLPAQLEAVVAHAPEIVITSVGSPKNVVPALHDAGAQVWADVATVHHAERALEAGVDGLVLLGAGAGGHTGWANPFAFVRAVRERFDGTLVLAGGVSDGASILAAEALGCDLCYLGTRFIASAESRAQPAYKQMIVDSELDDIQLTDVFSGMNVSMMRKSLVANGLDPRDFGVQGASGGPLYAERNPGGPREWRDIWSAGHSASGIHDVAPVAEIVDRLEREYHAARAALRERLR
ncbi:nitronate monooxygenase [Gryllotalpicola koreensis]|uniref:Nitronate monooxygenase n=1 Tax=Gryllotalpicola koreensis TaxID=993086 RepID=A0ABP7ZYE2_9MICO